MLTYQLIWTTCSFGAVRAVTDEHFFWLAGNGKVNAFTQAGSVDGLKRHDVKKID